MNPVLGTRDFWQPYLTLEPQGISATGFAAQLDELRADFVVREDPVTFSHKGRKQTVMHPIVEFPFSCGRTYSLQIDYAPAANGGDKTLFLIDARSGVKHQLGWWDLARRHPYCLHPDELDHLLAFWRRCDPRWQTPNMPLLLLCQFVGLPDSAALASLARRAEAAYRSLVPSVVDGDKPAVPLQVPDDYRWELDAELGWVFTSDDYCCYSIRNRPHEGSEEGSFPFATFGEMMSEIREQNRLGN